MGASWQTIVSSLASPVQLRPMPGLPHAIRTIAWYLANSTVIDRQPIGEGKLGANEVVLEVPDTKERFRAVEKAPGGPEWGVSTEKREATYGDVAFHFNLGNVPRTLKRRRSDGIECSYQLFALGAKRADLIAWSRNVQLHRVLAEVLRGFDYVMGNRDRHLKNLMCIDERDPPGAPRILLPIGIDHGLCLPDGPLEDFRWPLAPVQSHTGPITEEARAFFRSIDPRLLASMAARNGIEKDAIVHALRRLERLKRDPSFLEVPPWTPVRGDDSRSWEMLRRMGANPTQGLDRKTLDAIDVLVDEMVRRSAIR
jgi:hypothetical protein